MTGVEQKIDRDENRGCTEAESAPAEFHDSPSPRSRGPAMSARPNKCSTIPPTKVMRIQTAVSIRRNGGVPGGLIACSVLGGAICAYASATPLVPAQALPSSLHQSSGSQVLADSAMTTVADFLVIRCLAMDDIQSRGHSRVVRLVGPEGLEPPTLSV